MTPTANASPKQEAEDEAQRTLNNPYFSSNLSKIFPLFLLLGWGSGCLSPLLGTRALGSLCYPCNHSQVPRSSNLKNEEMLKQDFRNRGILNVHIGHLSTF